MTTVEQTPSTPDAARIREMLLRRRAALERKWERRIARGGPGSGDYLSRTRLPELLMRAAGLWQRGRRNAMFPQLRSIRISYPDLPSHLQGLRILHMSDLHFHAEIPEFAEVVRDLFSGVNADLCAITGDFRFSHRGGYSHVFLAMETVLSGIHTTHGTVAVMGNHDLGAFVAPFESMGIRVLMNANSAIRHAGGVLWVAGVDDHHRFRCDSLKAATDGIPQDEFTLLLAHSPELAMDAPGYGVRLYLCGHTHWGQIRFPLLGALSYNARCPKRFCMGRWTHETTEGYTTAGIGTTDLPIRYNCPPEACLLELARA